MRLHDGDMVDVWEGHGCFTRLVFHCAWGGSAAPRKTDSGEVGVQDDDTPAGDENRDPKLLTLTDDMRMPPPPPPSSSIPSRKQPPQVCRPETVTDSVASRLDEAYVRAEKMIHNLGEHDLKMQEADHDAAERARAVERERERSLRFEQRRVAALREVSRRGVQRGKGCGAGGGSVKAASSDAHKNYGFPRPLANGKAVGHGAPKIAAGVAGA